jgi:hypothetical protein
MSAARGGQQNVSLGGPFQELEALVLEGGFDQQVSGTGFQQPERTGLAR